MTIYSFVTIVLLFFFFIEQGGIKESGRKCLFLICAFLVFFIMAFRASCVGGDTIEYVHFWQGIYDAYGTWKEPNKLLVFEPGLSWLCYFLHLFNDGEPWFFLLSTAIITLAPFLYIVWRDSKFAVLPILLYMTTWGLLDISYTGLRQVIGVGLCMFAYIVWTTKFDKRKLKYILISFIMVLALSFHTSMYFTIPSYICFLLTKPIKKRNAIYILLISLLFGILSTKIIVFLFEIIGSAFTSFDILFRLNHYFEGNNAEDGLTMAVIGMQQVLTTLLVCLIVYYSDKDKHNRVYYSSLVLACSAYNVFVSFPQAGRFLYPLMLMGIVLSPSQINIRKPFLYRFFLLAIVFVLSIHQIYVWEVNFENHSSDAYLINQMFPYFFVWE